MFVLHGNHRTVIWVWYFCQNTGLKLRLWTKSWKVQKMDKCVAFPVVFSQIGKSFQQMPSLCVLCSSSAMIPREMNSCVWHVANYVWNEFANSQNTQTSKLGGVAVCGNWNTFSMLSKSFWYWKKKITTPCPQSKIDLNFLHNLENVCNPFRISMRCALFFDSLWL